MTLFGERLGALRVGRIVGEQLWIMQLQHAGAGPGGRHHIVEALENIDNLTRDRLSVGPVSRIEGRLATTGLGEGNFDPRACVLQQFDRGKANRGPEQIDQAGYEQADKRGLARRNFGHVPLLDPSC